MAFFYSAFEAPSEDDAAYTDTKPAQQLKLHLVGTSPEAERVFFELPDEPEVGFTTQVTDDDRWLVIYGYRGTDPAMAARPRAWGGRGTASDRVC